MIGKHLRLLATAGALAATLAACGAEAPTAGDGDAFTVSVSEPAANATVAVPFTVTVASSVPLGTTESGLHHVHVWFDDNENDYQVVEAPSVTISDLTAGPHVVHVSLRNANHSAAGAETEVPITVGASAAATTAPAPDPAASEPDQYGY